VSDTIIVTGGAGFIGSALVWRLNQLGEDRILLVDRLRKADDPRRRNLDPLAFSDLLDADEFLKRVEQRQFDRGVDTLFHMGAISSTTETDLELLKRNNTDYTRTLAAYALRREIRFIYASSAATYGDGSAGFSDDPAKLDQLHPLNPYGRSKHAFDCWARDQKIFDRIVGLKYFNVFGPNEQHKGDMRSLVAKAYEQIRDRGSVRLFKSYRPEYADGEQRRDFVYVKDAVEMTLFFRERPEVSGLFNVGSGRSETWLSLVRPIFQTLKLPERIDFIDMPEEIRDQYQYETQADIHRIRRAGYEREMTPLSEAVRDYVGNHLVPGRPLSP
jgi:ADP-L-glycero-D-manno-heptose 6-epimerase